MKKLIFRIFDLIVNITIVLTSFLDFPIIGKIRSYILNTFGLKINHTSFIDSGTKFYNSKNISIGKEVSIGHYNKFWGFGKIRIEDYCQTALGVTFISGSHNLNNMKPLKDVKITIKKGVWIGANATIVGPCTIGKGCIIGAGALVINDLEPMGIYAGVPAKLIKRRIVDKNDCFYSPRGEVLPTIF